MKVKLFGRKTLLVSGTTLVFISLILSGLVFYPVISAEIQYKASLLLRNKLKLNQPVTGRVLGARAEKGEKTFDIVIPKLYISSSVTPNIDPFNKEEYLNALKEGVAHAKGSTLPGEEGNVFIFAHSTDSPLNISRYNAVFYLVNKLEKGDEVDLFFGDKKFQYKITDIKIVSADAVEYLQKKGNEKTLTLMTCWPPGTTLKRLLIIGKQVIG